MIETSLELRTFLEDLGKEEDDAREYYCGWSGILALLTLLTAAFTSVQAAPVHDRKTPAPKPIIMISDVATGLVGGWRPDVADVDDGWAIAMALAEPTLELRGVVVTFGNGLVEPAGVVAEKIVHDLLGEVDVPVLRGAATALSPDQTYWYDGTPLNPACVNEGVRFMADELLASEQPVTLVGTGPLTDVACLVQNFPAAVEQVAELIVLMGREPAQEFRIGAKTGLTDFNHIMDEQAIGVILEYSEIPVSYMTFPLTSSALVPQAQVEAYSNDKRPLARFFTASALNWIDQWQRWGFDEGGFHPWDNNPVYYAAYPEDFRCAAAETALVVSCAGAPNHAAVDNLCAGHGPDQPASLDKEGSQLWLGDADLCKDDDDSMNCQSQVAEYRGGTVCTAYADDDAKNAFLNAIFTFLGEPR